MGVSCTQVKAVTRGGGSSWSLGVVGSSFWGLGDSGVMPDNDEVKELDNVDGLNGDGAGGTA